MEWTIDKNFYVFVFNQNKRQEKHGEKRKSECYGNNANEMNQTYCNTFTLIDPRPLRMILTVTPLHSYIPGHSG